MTPISKVRRCLRLAANPLGRDLIVGDLHGHRSLLERELDRLRFNPAFDRVLSVGDLIDRGPESIDTLALIEEPWFHAVLGNHELMLLNDLGYYNSRASWRGGSPRGGRRWLREAAAKCRKRLMRLADRVAALPLAIHVDTPAPFNVMHSDLLPLGATQDALFCRKSVCIHSADVVTSSRRNFVDAQERNCSRLIFAQHPIKVSDTPFGSLPLTYVGHSPVGEVVVHNSYVYIDQGVSMQAACKLRASGPTVLLHREFSYWLKGVVSARARSLDAAEAGGKGSAAYRERIAREAPARLDILSHRSGVVQ